LEQFQSHKITLVVAALIADPEQRILMVREAQPDCYGLWNQPAGHVDAGESITDALLREVKEENGSTA
jgi:8-oxo-dGTP diphosphatase